MACRGASLHQKSPPVGEVLKSKNTATARRSRQARSFHLEFDDTPPDEWRIVQAPVGIVVPGSQIRVEPIWKTVQRFPDIGINREPLCLCSFPFVGSTYCANRPSPLTACSPSESRKFEGYSIPSDNF